MAIVIKEDRDSPVISADARGFALTRTFFARGTDDESDLYAAILAQVESVYDGLIRTSIKTPKKSAGGLWEIEIEYGDPGGESGAGSGGTPVGETPSTPSELPTGDTPLNPVTQGIEFTFDTATATQHITQSLLVMSSVGIDGATPKDIKGAIGLDANGTVHGCDIHTGETDFTATVKRPEVTLNYMRTLGRMVATFNNDTWGGFESGESLYMGCNGQGTQRGEWTINHRFKFKPNQEVVTVSQHAAWQSTHAYVVGDRVINDSPSKGYVCTTAGTSAGSGGPTGTGGSISDGSVVWSYVTSSPGIVLSGVRGWDYVDVAYGPSATDGLSRPIAAYVHKVYNSSSFGDLEIGV